MMKVDNTFLANLWWGYEDLFNPEKEVSCEGQPDKNTISRQIFIHNVQQESKLESKITVNPTGRSLWSRLVRGALSIFVSGGFLRIYV